MWKLAAAATTGTSHLRSGAPCQDRHAFVVEGDNLIVAVADGAGSAPRSDQGAQVAVDTAVAYLTPHLNQPGSDWEELVLDAAVGARQAVLAVAAADGLPAREYATTLLILALAGHGGAALQIGDGLVAYNDGDAWGYVFWPQKGQYANSTNFLIEEDAESKFERARIRQRFTEIAVMSDGLENIALHFASQTVHEPFLNTVLSPLRSATETGVSDGVSRALEGFLRSDRISSRTDDDLTLVLATRSP
jgi:hypothetical protein